MEEKTGPSLVARVVAALVLAVAAWLLLKAVIGVVAGLAWLVAVVVLLVAVLWAVRTLF
jgi:hypothetical protein